MSEPFGSRHEALQHLRVADSRWTEAVRTFHAYPERLRRLAESAENQRKAFMFAEICGVKWQSRETGPGFHLAPELEAPNRIGPADLWAKFDAAVKRFGKALAGDELLPIANAFGDMGQVATQIADALEDGTAARKTG